MSDCLGERKGGVINVSCHSPGRRDSYYDVRLFSFYSSSSYDTTSHT